MAGTTAPRRKRAKQKALPDMEDARIKEVVDAAENYVDCRNERMGLTDKEVDAKEKLIEVMRKHDLTVYKFDAYTVVLSHKESDDVKVQEAKESDEADAA